MRLKRVEQVGRVRRDFQKPAIDEAPALLESVEARASLPLWRFPEGLLAPLSLPAEDDAVTAVVPFFQRGPASFPPRNRVCGGQRRDRNVTPTFSRVFPL